MPILLLDPGMLNTRLELEAPVDLPDGRGGATRNWEHVISLWGRVEPVSARSAEIAAALSQRVTHRVTVRARTGLRPGMRFLRRGRAFAVSAVNDPDETGRFLTCLCEETPQ